MNDRLDCQAVDELDAAFALGALEPDEARAVASHLDTCAEPHAELRAILGAGEVLSLGLDPVQPSPGRRDRLMASIERTPQDRGALVGGRDPPAPGRSWLGWISPRVARPLALAAVAATLAVAGWNLTLQSQLGERDRALREVAAAISGGEAAFRVDGSAGRGYVVETPGSGAALVIADLASLPADQLYELWLIDADGAVAVGTFTPSGSAIAVVPVDRDLTGFATFAVTVEAERVDAPTTTPVMVGDLTAS
ncbi:MAG: anti-sigma factor [Chloroflexota bacterium]